MGKRLNRWIYQNEVIRRTSDFGDIFTVKNNLGVLGLFSGHIIQRHVGVSISSMLERMSGEFQTAYDCTSYKSYGDCVDAVSFGLVESWDIIKPWLDNKDSKKTITVNCKMPSGIEGYGICAENTDSFKICNSQCIVLRKTTKNKFGCCILTAYPTYKDINPNSRYRHHDDVKERMRSHA